MINKFKEKDKDCFINFLLLFVYNLDVIIDYLLI